MSTVAFIQKVNSKTGTGRNGKPYTLYSMKLSDKDGNELDGWYQCGFDKPAANEGDYIQCDVRPAERGQGNFDVDVKSIKVAKNPPARAKTENAPAASGGASHATVKTSELFGDIGGYNTEDDIRRMSYSAARSTAVDVVGLLLENDALKLVKADTKAGAASRFDLITAAVDKLTVQYFFDAASGRKLETVADEVAAPAGDGDLPDTADETLFDDEPTADMGESDDDPGFE